MEARCLGVTGGGGEARGGSVPRGGLAAAERGATLRTSLPFEERARRSDVSVPRTHSLYPSRPVPPCSALPVARALSALRVAGTQRLAAYPAALNGILRQEHLARMLWIRL